ncbi:Conserved hypothetical protein [Yarrowia lipolytica]|nr:Conserved hypothetical protein [Yarrowia lipolytica]
MTDTFTVPYLPCQVKAIYSWSGEEDNDLGFIEGDIIDVLNTGDGNWWTGKLRRNNVTGVFPRNFVVLDEPKGGRRPHQPPQKRYTLCDGDDSYNGGYSSADASQVSLELTRSPSTEVSALDIAKPVNGGYKSLDPAQSSPQSFDPLAKLSMHLQSIDLGHDPLYPPVPPHGVKQTSNTRSGNQSTNSHNATYDKYSSLSNHKRTNSDDGNFSGDFSGDYSGDLVNHKFDRDITPRHNGLDRTPSPLRNAMDDVLLSLDGMKQGARAQQDYRDFTPTKDRPYGAVHTPMAYRPEARRQLSYHEKRSSWIQSAGQKTFHMGDNESAASSDDEENVPFSPDSYGKLPFSPDSYSGGSAGVHRADTVNSYSSEMTKMSGVSGCSLPTTVSDFSATSAADFNMRQGLHEVTTKYMADIESTMKTDSADYDATEVPVALPNQLGPEKSLKMRKSTGFLKKFIKKVTNTVPSSGSTPNMYKTAFVESSPSSRASPKRTASIKSNKSSRSLRSIKSLSAISFSSSNFSSAALMSEPSKTSNVKQSAVDPKQWIEIRQNVHRANTVTAVERKERQKKLALEGIRCIEPLKKTAQLISPRKIETDLSHVDRYVRTQMSSLASSSTPHLLMSRHVMPQFQYEIERLRAVFMFCSEKLKWTGDHAERYDIDLQATMQSRKATTQEVAMLVSHMCAALGVHCQVIPGMLKAPGGVFDSRSTLTPNHFWNAVLVDDQWRVMDCTLANPSFPLRYQYSAASDRACDDFYFLASPAEAIYTHIPTKETYQHLEPGPLDLMTALALPVLCPKYWDTRVKLTNYDTTLMRLKNLEVGEVTFTVSPDMEIFADVQPGSFAAHGHSAMLEYAASRTIQKVPTLCQVYWEFGKRIYRVKAVLPPGFAQGLVNVYCGPKGKNSSHRKNHHPVVAAFPITHSGTTQQFEFVIRHPTPHCKLQDLYVVQPQCYKLTVGNIYHFAIKQHPSSGINSGSGFARTKIAIQPPSGKITKLVLKEDDSTTTHGLWELSVKCTESGPWRALVLTDSGSAWSVFAEWLCS